VSSAPVDADSRSVEASRFRCHTFTRPKAPVAGIVVDKSFAILNRDRGSTIRLKILIQIINRR
jgi:hypothetical protein